MGLLGDFFQAQRPAAVLPESHDFLARGASSESRMADLGAVLAR